MYEYYEDYEDTGDPFPALRGVLAPAYRDLPAEDVEELLAGAGLSAEDMEFSLSSFGRTLGSIGQAVLPVAGTVVGTAFGGPVGAALGGALGSAAGSALGAATAPRRPARRPGVPIRGVPGGIARRVASVARPVAAVAAAPVAGGPAANQLLGLLQRPELLQAVQALALGGLGAPRVPVGSTPVPPAAFANLLGVLAGEALAEHHALVAGGDEGLPEYLLGADGEAVVDASDANERAARLLELVEQEAAVEAWEGWYETGEDLDAVYDAYEYDEVAYG